MIRELHIQHVAVIEDETVPFGPGLNVITGETGSGKSVIMQSLELILGARLKPSLLRTGAEELKVTALLDLEKFPESLQSRIPDSVRDEEGELLVTRTATAAGKGKVYINGSLASLSILQETLRGLVTICSQGEFVQLLDARYHLEVLDNYAAHDDLLREYHHAWSVYQEKEGLFLVGEEEEMSRSSKIEQLQSVVEDLDSLSLTPGLREVLEQRVKKLSNAERLIQIGHETLHQYAIEVEGIGKLKTAFAEMQRLDDGARDFVEEFKEADALLGQIERSLRRYTDGLSLDEEALEVAREQLANIARFERKYRTNDAGLLELLTNAKRELQLSVISQSKEVLKQERDAAFRDLQVVGRKLSESRGVAARKFSKAMVHELAELNMKDVRMNVALTITPPHKDGMEKAEFFIATNPGEDEKPLKHVASGGELSRILLVLKKLLRDRGGVSVLVFDEVDSGVSGGVARAIGQKLRALAKDSQVICITHLPQVASLADHHLLVTKTTGKRAQTSIKRLSNDERIEEIARMLAGFEVSASARESAKELLISER